MRNVPSVTHTKKFRWGNFFFGFGMGFLFLLLLLGGLVCYIIWGLTINKVEKIANTDIIHEDELGLGNKNLIELLNFVGKVTNKEQDITLNQVKATFKIDIPNEIKGISIAPILDVSIMHIADKENIDKLLKGITLQSLSTAFDFTLPTMPIIARLKVLPITELINSIDTELNFQNKTIGTLATDFGFSLPDNGLINVLKNKTFTQLTEGIEATVMDLTVGEIMTIPANDKLLNAIKDFKIGNLSTDIMTVKLGALIEIDPSSPLAGLADTPLNSIQTDINDLPLGSLIDPGTNKILIALKDTPISGLADAINTLQISDMIDIPADNKILNAISGATLTNIAATINGLTLGDVIEAGDNKILQSLATTPINGLGAKIDTLKIGDMMEIPADNKVLNLIKDETLATLPAKFTSFKVGDFIDANSADPILLAIKDININNLSAELPNAIKSLKIEDIIVIDSGSILAGLQGTTITDFPTAIENMVSNDFKTLKLIDLSGKYSLGLERNNVTEKYTLLTLIEFVNQMPTP